MQDYRIPPPVVPAGKPKKRSRLRFLMTMAVTTALIATGGFGTFPDNPITNIFREEIAQNFPPEILGPFNSYTDNFSVPPIEPKPDSRTDTDTPPDPLAVILELFQEPSIGSTPELAISPEVVNDLPSATEPPEAGNVTVPPVTEPAVSASPGAEPVASDTATEVPSTPETPVPVLSYNPPPRPSDDDEEEESVPAPTPDNLPVVIYSAGTFDGNLGGRGGADDFCSLELPAGYANYRAFIALSAADNFTNMPSNYSIPEDATIKTKGGAIIALDWNDLINGNSLSTDLQDSGVISGSQWWSGAENALGGNIDGSTPDCNNWASNSSGDTGYYGGATMISHSVGVACNNTLALLCVAYP